ncbi:MAG: Rieske 2Fe-2S domain-containing protein [Alphaproteobacteria bacterium]|nr:Rieske 2Fe-2S domain-containing protein [Alphaproteobacteria bacterium]
MSMLLSHDHYFSDKIFQQEKEALFLSGEADAFIGYAAWTPERGDYYVLPHTNNTKFIRHDGERISLIDNICRHRYALMLEGKGRAERIVCPVHMWSYDGTGALVKSPGIECDKAKHSLACEELKNVRGFLVKKNDRRLEQALIAAQEFTNLDFAHMHFLGHEAQESRMNWKDYIETFLELYHVEPYHPGLRGMVDCARLQNRYGDRFHLQAVEARDISLKNSSKKLAPFIEKYEREVGAFDGNYGAIWLTIYPNVLVEIYGKFAVFAHVIPESAERFTVHKYSFCDPSVADHAGLISSFNELMNQVEIEDLELMQKIYDGRKTLYQRGDTHIGPVHPTMEDGQPLFHDYLRRTAYGAHLALVGKRASRG